MEKGYEPLDQNGKGWSNYPIIANMVAILIAPYVICCALPGLVFGLLSYSDYRVGDEEEFGKKHSRARCCTHTALVIISLVVIIVVGLVIGFMAS